MTTSLYMPDVVVEIAFGSGIRTPAASRVWTDVSAYVELEHEIEIDHGRGDRVSTADANALRLVLDNKDGRFTAGLTTGAYYPNVKIGTPIRVKATRVGGAASTRYTGFVDEWPVEWDGTNAYAFASIKASSRMASLGRGRKLRSIVEEEILLDRPVAYYTLGEAEGAASAADVSGNSTASLVQAGSGAAVTFGTATGPGTDGLTAASFTGGKRLSGLYGSTLLSGVTAVVIEAFFASSTTAQQQRIMSIANSGGTYVPAAELISLGIDQTTGVLRGGFGVAGVNVITSTSPNSVADGNVHHAAYWVTISGGNATGALWLDGVQVDSDIAASGAFPTTIDTIHVGGDPNATSGELHFTGSIAHAAVHAVATEIADARLDKHAAAGLTGFAGESPADRLTRYAAYAGAARGAFLTDFDTGTSPIAHVDTTGKSVLEGMRTVESTDAGVLYDGRDGTLEFRARSSRYTAASSFTLSFATQQIEASYRAAVDRTEIQNDVTATLADGTVTARALNQASVDAYDALGEDLELATTDANEPHAAAWWRVNAYAEPRARVPSLGVDLLPLSAAMQDSILAADVGTRFATTGAPNQAAASTGDYFIEGYTETIGPESYRFTFNVSDAGPYVDTLVLDSATRGLLDTNRLAY